MQDASGADQATLVDQSVNQQQMVSQDQDVGGGPNIVGGDNTYYQGIDQSGDAAGYGVYTEQIVVADDGMGGQAVYCEETGAVQFADGSVYEYDYLCEVDVNGDTYAGDDCGGDTYTGDDYGGDTCGGNDYGGNTLGGGDFSGGDCY
jgi:hypothetical protein